MVAHKLGIVVINTQKRDKMKQTFTQQPTIPTGYTGRDYASWQKYLQEQIEKARKARFARNFNL